MSDTPQSEAVRFFQFLRLTQKRKGTIHEDITLSQLSVVVYLGMVKTWPKFRDLAEALTFTRTKLSRILILMEDRNLVRRIREPSDRRTFRIGLTEPGAALASDIESFFLPQTTTRTRRVSSAE